MLLLGRSRSFLSYDEYVECAYCVSAVRKAGNENIGREILERLKEGCSICRLRTARYGGEQNKEYGATIPIKLITSDS